MKFLFVVLALFPLMLLAQDVKLTEAPVDVMVTNFEMVPSPGETILFRGEKNGKTFQGVTDRKGKFSTKLPPGDKYEILILGFNDSTSQYVMEIPPLPEGAYYTDAFTVEIQYEPASTFVLKNCNFETGKSILKPESYKVIDELIEYMKKKSTIKIEIGGHTDNIGSESSNQVLSEERAQAVRKYMISKGIAAGRIIAKGYGLSSPIADNETEEGRALNRRTEVKILE